SQGSEPDSLEEEMRYQLGLQQQILDNEELLGLCSEEMEDDSLEGDSLEERSFTEEEEAECDTNTCGVEKNHGGGRKQQPVDKYSNLRYNPNWKDTIKGEEFSEVDKTSPGAGRNSLDLPQNSFYLHSNDSLEEKDQQEAKAQDSFSELSVELFSFHEPNVLVNNEPVEHAQKKEPVSGSCSKGSSGTSGSALPVQSQQERPQRAKKNFVKRNKQTLGLNSERINSYLELHNKKQQVLQEQVTDPKTDDDETLQGVQPVQTVKTKPEDQQYLQLQQLKGQHNQFFQRNKVTSNQDLKGRAFPRNESQEAPGRPADPEPWQHSHHHTSGSQAAPTAVEQDKSRALQECLCPTSAVGPNTHTAAKPNTCLNSFPTSGYFVSQDFIISPYPFHPTCHTCIPAEVPVPAYTSKENKNYQHDALNNQQHLHSHIPGQHFARDAKTHGQAQPSQRNIPSTFNANFQE
ncbi:Uncharacterized protein C11orf63, partial [Acanthisitta chloris]